jgi:hypothetical protein
MDLIDVIWNSSQDVKIRDVRVDIDRMQAERDLGGWDACKLSAENAELKLRLCLLVRLLIGKGIISAQEYAALIAEAQPGTDERS